MNLKRRKQNKPTEALTKLKKEFLKVRCIKKSFTRIAQYYDEPKIYQYSTKYLIFRNNKKIILGGVGTSFSKEKAKVKSLGESLERLSLLENLNSNDKLIKNSFKDFIKKEISFKTEEFVENVENFENKHIYLTDCYKFPSYKKTQIPAQLIFVPYKYKRKEIIIRPPISTGAALGKNKQEAILNGLLEVIERDAFVLSYYKKNFNNKIDIRENELLNTLDKNLSRCKLEWHLIDISNNLGPYTFLSILLDKTDYGPPLSAGLKCGYDPMEVAIGSLEESLHSRTWVRDIMFSNTSKRKPRKIESIEDRLLFWLDPEFTKKVNFYFKKRPSKKITSYQTKKLDSTSKQLKKLTNLLRREKMNIYVKELSNNNISLRKFKSVKVIVDKLLPLYLDERYVFYNNSRLKKGDIKNKFPHFFL